MYRLPTAFGVFIHLQLIQHTCQRFEAIVLFLTFLTALLFFVFPLPLSQLIFWPGIFIFRPALIVLPFNLFAFSRL